MRIIIVEDEINTRLGLLKLLKTRDNVEVIADAEDGIEGLRLIKDLQPDLVIADICMPKMDGLTMIECLEEVHDGIKFIILSGHADFEYAKQGIRLGIDEYLLKPITKKELLESLDRIETKISRNENSFSSSKSLDQEQYHLLVSRTLESIHQHYAKKITLEDFSLQFNVTPEYMSRLFAKEVGKTFSAYLKEYRIQQAMELLKNREIKMYEVACRVGYDDVHYFSRVFKEQMGISPKKYSMSN